MNNEHWLTGEHFPVSDYILDYKSERESIDSFFIRRDQERSFCDKIWAFPFVSEKPELGLLTLVLGFALDLPPIVVPTKNTHSPHDRTMDAQGFADHDFGHASKLSGVSQKNRSIFSKSREILHSFLEKSGEMEPGDIKKTVVGLFYNFHEGPLQCMLSEPKKDWLDPLSSDYEEMVKDEALEDKGGFPFLLNAGYPMTYNPYIIDATHEIYLGFITERDKYLDVLSCWFGEYWKDILIQD